ncbi:hypothetical protein DMH15_34845 [Streptomyces sp. WAC 06725]|nr:hypothetical protein DMH15_34845 [Streptomyces sp. WAC 06725]
MRTAPPLDSGDRDRLLSGAHHDPHALLGAHPLRGGGGGGSAGPGRVVTHRQEGRRNTGPGGGCLRGLAPGGRAPGGRGFLRWAAGRRTGGHERSLLGQIQVSGCLGYLRCPGCGGLAHTGAHTGYAGPAGGADGAAPAGTGAP